MTSQLFDAEDEAILDNAIKESEALRPEIVRAKSAGFDVTKAEQELEETITKLRAIRNAYVPNR